ncbi:MAG: ECF transporter S component [Erysipelotrichaceae bacterium]|nr:ECF transporter S component [Erysipelotrichaceae bacterium]
MDQLEQFTNELHEWTLNGREPVSASIGLRYLLDKQEARLKALGIQREEEFIHVKDELKGSIPREGNGFTSKIIYREARQNVTYRQNGKEIKKISRPVDLYVSFVDREGTEPGTCTCPNCGHIMPAIEARDGCPYCGTHFEIDEVYPCAGYYYTVSGIVERGTLMDNFKREMIIAGVIAGIAVAAMAVISWNDLDIIFRILGAGLLGAFYGLVFAFIWYMIRSLILMGKAFYEAGRAMPMLKSLNSRKKMTKFMQSCEPSFSFEAFEGKILSLIRSIAFEDDRDSLSIWEGSRDLSELDQAADMQYRGALYIRRHEKEGDILRVQGTAFMTNTYVSGRKVRERDEQFNFTAEKKIDPEFHPEFTFLKVTCDGCNGSFDAMHQRCCPYCGREYEPKKKDWVLTDLKRK